MAINPPLEPEGIRRLTRGRNIILSPLLPRPEPDGEPCECAIVLAQGMAKMATVVTADMVLPCDDEHAVSTIYSLWASIALGRRLLTRFGAQIIAARQGREFQCMLGTFPSATRAVQVMAERLLEELWRVGHAAAALTDRFRAESPLLPFAVDGWHDALPALRCECRTLGLTYGLVEEHSCWDSGLLTDLAAVELITWQVAQVTTTTPAAPRPPADGDVVGNRVWIRNREIELTVQLAKLLGELIRGNGLAVKDVMRVYGWEDRSVLENRLSDLRKRLKIALRDTGLSVCISTKGKFVSVKVEETP